MTMHTLSLRVIALALSSIAADAAPGGVVQSTGAGSDAVALLQVKADLNRSTSSMVAGESAQGAHVATSTYITGVPVIDMTLFNGEQDMFALRVHELAAVVDVFLVFEGVCSFAGNLKTPVFNLKDKRIAEFSKKIVYQLVPCYNDTTPRSGSWANERATRDFMQTVFRHLGAIPEKDKGKAVVIAADIDEIPVGQKMDLKFRDQSFLEDLKSGLIFRVRGPMFYHNARCLKQAMWKGAHIFSGAGLMSKEQFTDWRARYPRQKGSTDLGVGGLTGRLGDEHVLYEEDQKDGDDQNSMAYLDNYGWHFSFFMTAEQVKNKLLTFSHTNLGVPPFTDLDHIRNAQRNCLDPFDRPRNHETRVPEGQEGGAGIWFLPAWMKEAASDGRLPAWWVTGKY